MFNIAQIRQGHKHFQAELARELDRATNQEQIQLLAWRAITTNRDLTSRTGRLLKNSKIRVIRSGKGRKIIKLSNSSKYAAALDLGSGLYGPKHAKFVIRPKKGKALRFVGKNGQTVFAAKVLHPGVKPTHFLYHAADSVGRQLRPWLEEAMRSAAQKF